MTTELAIVLGLLGVAIVMFALGKPRMDAVALLVLVALPLLGPDVVTMGQALAGFSDPNIVLIAALFVIGEGLVRTGVARRLGDWLIAKAGASETRLVALLMVVVCGLGSMMSSTAVTAIFIPVALRIAQNTGTSPSRLMMPLSTAALISGMTTLVATAPNLVVNSELVRHGEAGFNFFSFTPFGLPILALGIVYMLFARRWLAPKEREDAKPLRRPSLRQWIEEYGLADREQRVRVTERSPLAGRTIGEISREEVSGAKVIAIERGSALIQPAVNTMIEAGDILLVDLDGPDVDVDALHKKFAVEALPLSRTYFSDRSQDLGMAEVMLPADSALVGKTIVESEFRDRYGLRVIGLRRGGEAHGRGLASEDLRIGDTLLLIGPWRAIRALRTAGREMVLLDLPKEHDDVLPAANKAAPAVLILLLVIGLMVSGVVPNVQAALIGCLLMGAFGCIDMESAYRSIDWKTIVLIVGMLPFSIALQNTGGVDMAADAMMRATDGAGTYVILASLFAVTALLGMFISNTATAVLMAPVSLAVADELGASPYPFAMIIALAASTAFMTPVSSPVNTLVVTPGDYTFGDFLKVGVPFAIIVMIVCVFMVPWLLPL